MEELLMALATSLAESGPIWLLSFTGIVMFVWKIWPHIAELSRRRDEREDRRERRMEEYQKEQAERDGKWLIVSEQSARAMESMTEQMKVNNALLQDSKQEKRRKHQRPKLRLQPFSGKQKQKLWLQKCWSEPP